MANPLYQQMMSQQMPQQMNPMQRMNNMMMAMRNPQAFVRQVFPDIPFEISNDPNQILEYLKRTRGISDQQINQIMNQFPKF